MSDLDLSRPVKKKSNGASVDVMYILRDGEYLPIGYRESDSWVHSTRTDWRDDLENIEWEE